MSDYISKDETISTIWNAFNSYGNSAMHFEVEETKAIRKFCSRLQREIELLPTLDETEIIRKYGEQILDAFYGKHAEYRRLSEQANIELPQECYYSGHTKGFEEAIKIVKEECGISE